MPGDSAPGNVAGFGVVPVTVIGKSAATFLPPSLLTTCLTTISFGAMSSFVTVHVFVSPSAIEPVQSAE